MPDWQWWGLKARLFLIYEPNFKIPFNLKNQFDVCDHEFKKLHLFFFVLGGIGFRVSGESKYFEIGIRKY